MLVRREAEVKSLINILVAGGKKYTKTVSVVRLQLQHCVMEKSGMIIFCTSVPGQQNKVRAGLAAMHCRALVGGSG